MTEELISRLVNRDEAALLELYDQYGGLVYSIAVQILRNEQAAEEVMQDVFMKTWEKIGQFNPSQAKFTTWIARISRNTSIDALRKMQSRTPDKGEFPLEDYTYSLAANHSPDPQRTIALHSALKDLPQDQSELLYLAYFGGMSHNDIAEYTGIPLGTVKSRIRAAMLQLKSIFNPKPESNA
jgi:RNA polymerase sigma-70 factor (ECF subfamily)